MNFTLVFYVLRYFRRKKAGFKRIAEKFSSQYCRIRREEAQRFFTHFLIVISVKTYQIRRPVLPRFSRFTTALKSSSFQYLPPDFQLFSYHRHFAVNTLKYAFSDTVITTPTQNKKAAKCRFPIHFNIRVTALYGTYRFLLF